MEALLAQKRQFMAVKHLLKEGATTVYLASSLMCIVVPKKSLTFAVRYHIELSNCSTSLLRKGDEAIGHWTSSLCLAFVCA